jgi:hypothetical protein
MKRYPILSVVLATAVGCSNFQFYGKRDPSSLKAPKYIVHTNGDGDPVKVEKKPGDPDYVDPALLDEQVSQEILRKMQEKLMEISSITLEDIEPAQLALPDYDVASKTMRSLMKDSVVGYFDSLELIKKEVVRTLSELLALKRLADQERDPKGLVHQEYTIDVKKKIPGLNKRINDIYVKALDDLYSLRGNAIVPVSKLKRGVAKDPFKGKKAINLGTGLYGICSTSLCIKKLQSDLEDWHVFVRNFNNDVKFAEFGKANATWTKDGVNTAPLVTIALIDAAQDVLKLGLKNNKDYSIAGVIAKGGADALKTPAGVGLLILSAPVYLFEKTGRVIADMLSFNVMQVELALQDLDDYKQTDVFKGFRQNVKDYAVALNSAVYIAPGEDKSAIISASFRNALSKAQVMAPRVMDYFSAKELVNLETARTIRFQESLKYLSPERLEEIEDSLTDDQRKLLEIAKLESTPEKILDYKVEEIINILTKSERIGVFKPHIDKDPNLKAKIFELAPDIKKKYESAGLIYAPQVGSGKAGAAVSTSNEFKGFIFGTWQHDSAAVGRAGHRIFIYPKDNNTVGFTNLCWNNSYTNMKAYTEAEFAGDSLIIHWLGKSDNRKMLFVRRANKNNELGYSWAGSDHTQAKMIKISDITQQVNLNYLLGTWEMGGTNRVVFVEKDGAVKMQVVLWGSDVNNVNTFKEVDFYGNTVVVHWLGRADDRKIMFTVPTNGEEKMDYMWNCSPSGQSFIKVH